MLSSNTEAQVYLPSLIVLLLFISVVVVAAIVFSIYYRKGGKTLTGTVFTAGYEKQPGRLWCFSGERLRT